MKTTAMMFLMLCVLALPVSTQESNDGSAASAIRALEHEWVVAQSHNDNRALDLILDDSLVYAEYGKLVSKGEYLSRIKWSDPQLTQIVMEPMTVRVFGRTAIVVGAYRKRDVKVGKPQLSRWRFVHTWVYKKNGWALVAAGAAPLLNNQN